MNLRHPRHPRLKKSGKPADLTFILRFSSLSGLFLVSFKAYPETKKRKPCDDCE